MPFPAISLSIQPSPFNPSVTSTPTSSSPTVAPAVQAPHANPSSHSYRGYHHLTWWVGNARQAAAYFITHFGFTPLAVKGLETGSRGVAAHVVECGGVVFVFESPLRSSRRLRRHAAGGAGGGKQELMADEERLLEDMYAHLETHGDAVQDVAFEVGDVDGVYWSAVGRGAVGVEEPTWIEDGEGRVRTAKVRTYGDTTHTFVGKEEYRGVFLPGYKAVGMAGREDAWWWGREKGVQLEAVDHCVGNQDWGEMEDVCDL